MIKSLIICVSCLFIISFTIDIYEEFNNGIEYNKIIFKSFTKSVNFIVSAFNLLIDSGSNLSLLIYNINVKINSYSDIFGSYAITIKKLSIIITSMTSYYCVTHLKFKEFLMFLICCIVTILVLFISWHIFNLWDNIKFITDPLTYIWSNISLPAFSWPTISLPAFSWPTISLPAFSWPTISLPAFSLPAFSWPTISLPTISLPTIVN
jgi:hypothetical protein